MFSFSVGLGEVYLAMMLAHLDEADCPNLTGQNSKNMIKKRHHVLPTQDKKICIVSCSVPGGNGNKGKSSFYSL